MSKYVATIYWERSGEPFVDEKYRRGHTWSFDGGIEVPASSSPSIVPLPYSQARAVDPEEAFVAALSSCHMLWFLSIAARRGFCVDSYLDEAIGVMGRNVLNKLAITEVVLRPRIACSGDAPPTNAQIAAMHHKAHAECYIANSVTSEVRCEPVFEP